MDINHHLFSELEKVKEGLEGPERESLHWTQFTR